MPTPHLIGDLLPDYIGQTTSLDGGEAGGANIQLPPFKYGGAIYVAYCNILTDGSFRQFLAVGKSTDGGNTFISQDAIHAIEVNSNSAPSVLLDLPNNRVLFLVMAGSGDTPPTSAALQVEVFNLATGLWDSPLATGGPTATVLGSGPLYYNDWVDQILLQISPTKFMVLYYQAHSGQAPDIYSVTLTTSGVWGTPQAVFTASTNVYAVLSGIGVDINGVTWALYYKGTEGPLRFNFYFNSISTAGMVGSETLAYTSNNFGPRATGFGTYIAASDSMVWGLYANSAFTISPTQPTDGCLIVLSGVSTSASFSFEGVASRPSDVGTSGWGSPYFFTSSDGTVWYWAVNQITNSGGPLNFGVETIQLFQRPASGTPGVWSQSTFYDASLNPPGGPVYHNSPDSPTPPAELNSLSFTFLPDGTLATTVGMLSDWCGVIFYLSQAPSPPSPTTPWLATES